MPTSVMKPLPFGRMRSSAVGMCVWVPKTHETLPSRNQPIATFSLVASACMSTMMTGVTIFRRATSRSAARNGQSSGSMKTRPMTLSTPTFSPASVATTVEPAPGAPSG